MAANAPMFSRYLDLYGSWKPNACAAATPSATACTSADNPQGGDASNASSTCVATQTCDSEVRLDAKPSQAG